MNNRITYVRNERGDMVRKTVDVVKKGFEVVYDVVRIYADLLSGLLTLSIKIGLFCLLLPYIHKFVTLFLQVASESGGGGIF
jgi:hypothetical protein